MEDISRQQSASSATRARPEQADSTGHNLSVSFDPESQRHRSTTPGGDGQPDEGRRRSSFAERLQTFRSAGGVNSLDAFARSWQRAAGFHQITPVRPSFIYQDDAEADASSDDTFVRSELDTSPMTQRSLLREQLAREEETGDPHSEVFDTTPRQSEDLGVNERSPLIRDRPSRPRDRGDSIFQVPPQLPSSLGGTYGSTWGSVASRSGHGPPMRHIGHVLQTTPLRGDSDPDKEQQPLLVKQIQEPDGTIVNVVVGQSTVPQTILNSINTLIGVGILAVPLAMSMCGWIYGLGFLAFSAITTNYTAKVLAKCLDKDNSMTNYGDIAGIAGGKWSRWLQGLVSLIFLLELIGACVALVILFSDAIHALNLIHGVTELEWKLIFGCILVPVIFLPLRFLSWTSVIGIVCCFLVFAAVVFDGTQRDTLPGSLLQPMPTDLWPPSMWPMFYGFGILMAPWGGHSVFPNIYRDMRHPYHYRKGVDITYLFTFALVASMAVVGYLMFGNTVAGEITKSLVSLDGYPKWVAFAVTALIAITPITKAPLNALPIVSTAEKIIGIDHKPASADEPPTRFSQVWNRTLTVVLRAGSIAVFVGLAILVPKFDMVMSLIGSLCCLTICITFPCIFHLRLYGDSMWWWQKLIDYALIAISLVFVVLCTAANFVFIPIEPGS